MIAKTVAGGIVCALVLAGCASGPVVEAQRCDASGGCNVDVTVTSCHASANVDPIEVFGRNRNIHWEIVNSPGYTFADPGIVVGTDSTHEFVDGQIAQQGKKYILLDKNTFARNDPYPYEIKVLHDGSPCVTVDPGIINHG
ncbi:MAG TPA: hypothetical protein VF304_19300 [Casimicrobiaceae bacterium]